MQQHRRKIFQSTAAGIISGVFPTIGLPLWAATSARRKKLVLAGPSASVSNPLIRIVEEKLLADVADEVEFRVWKDPDQMRALALQSGADFMAMPTNVAANLFNRGAALRLLNVSVWGLLFVVSRDKNVRSLKDLAGKELVMPFRGDMPEIVFRTLATQMQLPLQGTGAVTLRYAATPLEAMQLLLTRRAEHALLAEPAVSVGLHKSRSLPMSAVAPELHRVVDLQQVWGQTFGRRPRIPQAGIAALGAAREDAALIARFMAAHDQAAQWCNAQADACGQMVARRIDLLTPAGVADAIRAVPLAPVSAPQARAELEFFFEQLLKHQAGLVGGKLPAADFYGSAA